MRAWKPHDIVKHVARGIGEGEIIRPWGSWWSCMDCGRELQQDRLVCPNCFMLGQVKLLSETAHDKRATCHACQLEVQLCRLACPRCNRYGAPLRVTGRGIFDVRFKNGLVRSVHQDRLKFVRRAPLPPAIPLQFTTYAARVFHKIGLDPAPPQQQPTP
jgi:hypothetical protein